VAVAKIWSQVLGVDKIGVGDNFFRLGGHSLLASQVLARIRSELDCELSLQVFFEDPSVSGLAQRLEMLGRSPKRPTPPPLLRVSREA